MSALSSGDPFSREWPRNFSGSRKPNDGQALVQSLQEHDPFNNGVRLFMQPYEYDKKSGDVETVARFCRGVRLEDLNYRIKSKKSTAWLDDRKLAAGVSSSPKITSSIHCPSKTPARPEAALLHNSGAEIRARDRGSSTQGTPASESPASIKPRQYAQCLSAKELYSHLREKRFDHPRLEDADRRLIYIADPDPCDILALTATASEHQAKALRDELSQFLDRQTSIKARIEPKGYQVFQLELHLPYYALRMTPLEEFRRCQKKMMQSGWMNLSLLGDDIADGVKGIHPAQFSLTICGTDNSRWIAYALEARSFDPDRGDDTSSSDWRSDEISMGEFDANNPIRDAREYFLNIFLIRAKQFYDETRVLVRFIEASCKRNGQRPEFSLTQGTNKSDMLDRNEYMLSLLRTLTPCVSKVIRHWKHFARPDKDSGYFRDKNMDYLPDTQERIVGIITRLEQTFDDIEALRDSLYDVEVGCDKLAKSLELEITRQSSQNSFFTINIISPIVIGAAILSIPTPIFSEKPSPLYLFITIVLVFSLLQVLLLLNGRWHRRQQWWEKLCQRAGAVWYGDDSLTTENEIGMRVFRRRSTHADRVREV